MFRSAFSCAASWLPLGGHVLATRGARFGVISRKVSDDETEALVHGNELLDELGVGTGEPHDRTGYTVEAVARSLQRAGPPAPSDELTAAFDWFAGYLVLDALVGNTDRHQDNWATIRSSAGERLSPSFDHASCPGFQVSDDERLDRLEGRGNRTVASYAAAARTKFEGRPSTFAAALTAQSVVGEVARRRWVEAVAASPDLLALVSDLPDERMNTTAKRFAVAVYAENRRSLSHLLPTMEP